MITKVNKGSVHQMCDVTHKSTEMCFKMATLYPHHCVNNLRTFLSINDLIQRRSQNSLSVLTNLP